MTIISSFSKDVSIFLNTDRMPMSISYRILNGEARSGVVSAMAQWDAAETRGWLVLQFTGLASLFLARCFLVVSIVPMSQELGWDSRQCGIVLSAFYWGYMLTQILGGCLSDRYGGDVVQVIAGVVWSLATLSSVFLAQVSIWPLVLARFLTGLAQGMHYPAMSSLVSNKVPDHTKTKFYGIAHAGAYTGATSVGVFGSLIIRWYHWKALVLVVTLFTISWVISLRLFSAAHNRKTHYKLSDPNLSPPLNGHPKPSSGSLHILASFRSIPWKRILFHSSVMAYFIAFIAECAFAHIVPSWSPTFFDEVYPSRSNSAWLYNGAPSLVTALGAYSGGLILNHLIQRNYDVTFVRKFGCCISLLIPSACLILMGVLGRDDKNYFITLFLLLLSSYFFGYTATSISAVCMDLSPSYSGSLYGVANTIGTLPGVFAVPLVGYILHSVGSWALVFTLLTAILLISCLVFLVYGSSRRVDLTLGPAPTEAAVQPSN